MAKVQEKLRNSHLLAFFLELFDSMLSSVIDSTLGLRCSSIIGYQYSEIVRSLMSVYFCGGSCVEDVTSHLMRHLSYHPTLRTCSSDTILRAIRELTQDNISYTSDQGKTYDFNTAYKLNTLLINALVSTGELKEVEEYDVDFDHQFIETEKYDAKPTYKRFLGYRPGVYVIGDKIVYIENSDGNTNVRFHQADTHRRFFALLESRNIRVNRFRADCGSCSKEIVSEIEKHCTYRCILTNDYESSTRDIVEFYNLRGGKKRIFDDMNNGFGWNRLPKSFMAENTVFLLLTALIHNFYRTIMGRLDTKAFGLKKTSRIKAFVFRFISVPAKWIMTARRYVLNIYTENHAYARPFRTEFG